MTSMTTKKRTVSAVLIDAIEKSGLTKYRLAQESGVSEGTLGRFLRSERTLTLPNVDKLATTLGLELKVTTTNRKGA